MAPSPRSCVKPSHRDHQDHRDQHLGMGTQQEALNVPALKSLGSMPEIGNKTRLQHSGILRGSRDTIFVAVNFASLPF